MSPRSRWFTVAAVVAVLVAGAAWFWLHPRQAYDGPINALEIDLRQPHLLVRSSRLVDLPAAVVRAPMLSAVLTEDFVRYYDDHPTRLTLAGTLKRLAYEHPLDWPDRLIATALSAPGEVALWRDGHGRLEHFVATLDQGVAAQAAIGLAKVVLPDKQLSVAATLPSGTIVYALAISPRTSWLIAARGTRLLVASTPGLLLDADGNATPPAAGTFDRALAAADARSSPFAEAFALPATPAAPRQQIVASADLLALGYRAFFPGVAAFRADLDGEGDGRWQLAALAGRSAITGWRDAAALWQAMPRGQALCAALPVEPARFRALVGDIGGPATQALVDDLQPSAAICWSARSGLFAPLLAMRLRDGVAPDKHDDALKGLLASALRSQSTDNHPSIDHDGGVPGVADSHQWTRTIQTEFGATRLDDGRADTVAVTRMGRFVLASTDVRAMEPAVNVALRTYPSLADGDAPAGTAPGDPAPPILAVDGPELRKLLEVETFRTLRRDTTPTFNRVARELLSPRLRAIGDLGRVSWRLPADSQARAGAPAAAPGTTPPPTPAALPADERPAWFPIAVVQAAAATPTAAAAPAR